MRRFLRATLRVVLWAVVVPYLTLLVVAFLLEAWSEATTTPLRTAAPAVPSEPRAGAPAPVESPPPVERTAPAHFLSTLPDRAVAFMKRRGGTGRLRREEEAFREYAILAEDVTRNSRGVDGEFVLAISFRESSWTPTVVGDAGEIGLMQLHYKVNDAVLRGYSVAAVKRSPSLQFYLGMRRLEAALDACHDHPLPALLHYASGRCEGPVDPDKKDQAVWSANRVLGWAEGMRRER
jgi:transglycosylase-like protein with SLT domain